MCACGWLEEQKGSLLGKSTFPNTVHLRKVFSGDRSECNAIWTVLSKLQRRIELVDLLENIRFRRVCDDVRWRVLLNVLVLSRELRNDMSVVARSQITVCATRLFADLVAMLNVRSVTTLAEGAR